MHHVMIIGGSNSRQIDSIRTMDAACTGLDTISNFKSKPFSTRMQIREAPNSFLSEALLSAMRWNSWSLQHCFIAYAQKKTPL